MISKLLIYRDRCLLFILAMSLVISLGTGCAADLGISEGSGFINDAPPAGTVIYQGNFTGLNGQNTIIGLASIYLNGSNYVLRLEGITAPHESNLQIKTLYTNGSSTLSLRAFTGNQNYNLTNPLLGTTFISVYIFSTLNNINYAVASLNSISSP